VHYVHFTLDDAEVVAMPEGAVPVVATHEKHRYGVRVAEIPGSGLRSDLHPRESPGRSAFMWFAAPRRWGTMPRCGQQPGDGTA
jgi:hypothetical protein